MEKGLARRLLALVCILSLLWEMFLRPLASVIWPGIELPPSLLKEASALLSLLGV